MEERENESVARRTANLLDESGLEASGLLLDDLADELTQILAEVLTQHILSLLLIFIQVRLRLGELVL